VLLCAEQISVTYRKGSQTVQALRDVGLSVARGELVVVAGPSGSGKTTLLMVLGGLLHPGAGRVRFDDTDVYGLSNTARAGFRNRHVGFVFQQFHLIPYLTVSDNVRAPSLAAPGAAHAEAEELIERFRLQHRAGHLPSALSTGERQRVALARALFNNPDLILADEPTGNLDEDNGRIVIEHLKAMAAEGRAVLMVTHDHRVLSRASRRLSLVNGQFVKLEGGD
jgi:ABC-type lipoprotein export system ATPase subunit